MTKLQVCECGKHGRFLFNDKAGIEFYSKEVAFNLAYSAIIMGRINEHDGERIYYEIDRSKLDEDGSKVESLVASKIDKWNAERYGKAVVQGEDDMFQDVGNLNKLIHT